MFNTKKRFAFFCPQDGNHTGEVEWFLSPPMELLNEQDEILLNVLLDAINQGKPVLITHCFKLIRHSIAPHENHLKGIWMMEPSDNLYRSKLFIDKSINEGASSLGKWIYLPDADKKRLPEISKECQLIIHQAIN